MEIGLLSRAKFLHKESHFFSRGPGFRRDFARYQYESGHRQRLNFQGSLDSVFTALVPLEI